MVSHASLCVFQHSNYFCFEFCTSLSNRSFTCAILYLSFSYLCCRTELFWQVFLHVLFLRLVPCDARVSSSHPRGYSPDTGPLLISQKFVGPDFAAASTLSRRPVTALLRKCSTRREADFTELVGTFTARDYCVMELELSLSIAALTEATYSSQITNLRASYAQGRLDHTLACFPTTSIFP